MRDRVKEAGVGKPLDRAAHIRDSADKELPCAGVADDVQELYSRTCRLHLRQNARQDVDEVVKHSQVVPRDPIGQRIVAVDDNAVCPPPLQVQGNHQLQEHIAAVRSRVDLQLDPCFRVELVVGESAVAITSTAAPEEESEVRIAARPEREAREVDRLLDLNVKH
eukprot:765396-Hanusia_phi.AAC.2